MRLVELINMSHDTGRWTTPEGVRRLREMTAAHDPGLPQSCRLPGAFAFFALLLIGEADRLVDVLDVTVDACRRYGYDWDLANVLQLRANLLANRGDWAAQAIDDADESLEVFVRFGDAWGAAEALSSRAEARERLLLFEEAAEDFTAAIGHAERIGAQAQVLLLRARYAGTLVEAGRPDEGEAILREILADDHGLGHEPRAGARMFSGWRSAARDAPTRPASTSTRSSGSSTRTPSPSSRASPSASSAGWTSWTGGTPRRSPSRRRRTRAPWARCP